jgi:protein required for attachment to host cells
MKKLIVVADAGRAVFLLQAKPNAVPDVVDEIDNPAGRAHARDLTSDRQGVSADSTGRHSHSPQTDPVDVEEERFARALADRLEKELVAADTVVLVMSPRFLGRFRGVLKDGVKKRVEHEIAKDFAHLSMHELKTRVHEAIKNA